MKISKAQKDLLEHLRVGFRLNPAGTHMTGSQGFTIKVRKHTLESLQAKGLIVDGQLSEQGKTINIQTHG